jgi:hypothetical protein
MAITPLPTPPSRQDPLNFSDEADAFLGALPVFQVEMNDAAVALDLNDVQDVSTSSVAIGLGAKTFTVTAAKSFLAGMFLVIVDAAAPSTNGMVVQITSYTGTTLVTNCVGTIGSGTKASWVISMTSPAGVVYGPINGTTGDFTGELEVVNTDGGLNKIKIHRQLAGDVASPTTTGSLSMSMTDTATTDQTVADISSQADAGTGDAFSGILRLRAADDAGALATILSVYGDGGVFMPLLKSGADQGAAGAAANELYRDTNDGNTIKMGV